MTQVVDYSESMINIAHLQRRIRHSIINQRLDHALMLIDEMTFETRKLKNWVAHEKAKKF